MQTTMMKQRSYSIDRSVKSDKVRVPKLDDRSVQSRRSVKSSATTGKLDKNGRRETKYREKPKSKRDLRASGPSHDKQPKNVSLDPPTEIRVVESQPVADWRNVSSVSGKSRRSTSNPKSFTLGKLMNRMSFRKKKPDEFSASATDAPSSVSGGASAKTAPRDTVSRRVSTLLPVSLRETAKSGSDVQSYVSDGNTRRKTRSSDGRRKTRLKALPAKDSDVPNFQHLLDAERRTILGTRGISHDYGESTDGDVHSVVSDGALLRSRKDRVKSDTQDKSQIKATQLRQTSQRSIHKPDMASDPSGDETQRISKVNFKPTTIARYMEDSTVSQCVRTVTTCEVDTLGASTSMTRKKMKKSKKKKHKHRSKSREKESNGQECRVMGFPFTELNTGIRGIYSGPVNDMFQPHGEGEFQIHNPSDGSRFQFKGTKWENGFMISHQLLMFRKTIEAGDLNVNLTYRDTDIHEEKRVLTKMSTSSTGADVASSLNSAKKKKHSKDENRQSSLVPMGISSGTISDGGKSDHRVNATATDYSLGEVARSRDDMLIAADSIQALKAASTIKIHDKAFLQRSNGLWTVAMLADRSMQPKNSYRVSSKWYTEDEIEGYKSEVLEESLLFVINLEGGTKIVPVRKKYFIVFIFPMHLIFCLCIYYRKGTGVDASGKLTRMAMEAFVRVRQVLNQSLLLTKTVGTFNHVQG
jgi:hypothetical protein